MLHVRVRAALTASSLASVAALSLVGCSLAGGGGDGSTATEPSASSSGAEQGGGTVVLATHESFHLPKKLVKAFETETGYDLEVRAAGDAGTLATKLSLTADNPIADAAFGIDNTFASRPLGEGAFAEVTTTATPPAEYALPEGGDRLVPIDSANVCVNVDTAWFEQEGLEPPRTLEDLADDRYRDLFVTPGASTSSPGMAFFLATVAAFGDSWPDYWTELLDNGTKVVDGWEDAYYGDFTAGRRQRHPPDRRVVRLLPGLHRQRRQDHDGGAARHVLPPGGVRRRAGGRRQPRGRRGAGRLDAHRRGAERAAGVDVRLPGDAGRHRPRGLGRVRAAAERPLRGGPRRDRRQPRAVADRLDGRHLAVSPATPGLVPRPATRPPRASRRIAGLLALAAAPVLVLGVLFVLPVAGMVAEGFVVDGRFAPGAVLDVLARPRVHRVAWFTVWTSGLATLLAVAVGLPAAYALHRLALPGRTAVRAALLVPFVLPTVVVGVAFRQLLGEGGPLGFLGLDGTPVAIVCGLVFFNVAVVVRTVGVAWESLDPRPGQAAAALGASPWQVLRTVTLPALRPAIVGSASIVFLFCATAFGIVLTLGGVRYSTVETEIYLLTTTVFDLQAAAALSVLQIVVVVGLLALSARLRATPDPTAQRVVTPVRAVRRSDAPVVVATLLVLAAMLAADPHARARVADASATAGDWTTTVRSPPPATTRSSSCRSPPRSRRACAPPSTPCGWRSWSAAWCR